MLQLTQFLKQKKAQNSQNSSTSHEKFLSILTKKDKNISLLDKIEWDFKDFTTQYLTHKFHSYPARFIPQIPLAFILLFTKEGDTVLDPMCGCGTTMVEAYFHNRNSIGNDFNPLAILISKVKTTMIDEDSFTFLYQKINKMEKEIPIDHWKINESLNNLPKRLVSKIFDRVTVSKLEAIKKMILELKEEKKMDLYDFTRVAFSSTIWTIVESEKGVNVETTFLKKIKVMEKEIIEVKRHIKNNPKVKLLQGDARKLKIEDESVDLIVTSPPYVNALDYYREHMYNMFWLGMNVSIFKKQEIGGHSHFVKNRFRLLSEYLGDMLRVMIEMNRVLKKGKICAIVVGNSSLEYELIESYVYFESFAKKIGFQHIKSFFRNIDKSKKYTNASIGKIDDEYIVVLKKTTNSPISSTDDNLIAKEVKIQMEAFRKKIKTNPGSSIRGRKPTLERISQNVERIGEAIETINSDIKIKI